MKDLIERIAKKHGVDASLLERMIQIEREKVHLEKRRNVRQELRKCIESAQGKK